MAVSGAQAKFIVSMSGGSQRYVFFPLISGPDGR